MTDLATMVLKDVMVCVALLLGFGALALVMLAVSRMRGKE